GEKPIGALVLIVPSLIPAATRPSMAHTAIGPALPSPLFCNSRSSCDSKNQTRTDPSALAVIKPLEEPEPKSTPPTHAGCLSTCNGSWPMATGTPNSHAPIGAAKLKITTC